MIAVHNLNVWFSKNSNWVFKKRHYLLVVIDQGWIWVHFTYIRYFSFLLGWDQQRYNRCDSFVKFVATSVEKKDYQTKQNLKKK